ncbi:MAG: hypothetical protein QNI98_06800 [Woeseiaceae bacterium]|nr:hypothetical protein [Woeseiaceae bacterium]
MVRPSVLLTLLFGATASASDDLTANIGFGRQGEAAMSDAGPSAAVAAKEHYTSLDWPVHSDDRNLLAVGFHYQYTRYEYTGINSRNRDLHHLQLPVRLRVANGDRRLNAYVAPGIATSSNVFKDFLNRGSGGDWYFSGAVEVEIGEPGRRWLLGAAYDRSFGESRMYPILGLGLAPGDNLNLRLAYPVSGITWEYSDRNTMRAGVMPAGFEWRVVTDDFASDFDYRVEGFRTHLNWTHRLFERWSIDLSAAYETDRRHEFVDDLGQPVVGYPQDEWILAITFGVGGTPRTFPHAIRVESIVD